MHVAGHCSTSHSLLLLHARRQLKSSPGSADAALGSLRGRGPLAANSFQQHLIYEHLVWALPGRVITCAVGLSCAGALSGNSADVEESDCQEDGVWQPAC